MLLFELDFNVVVVKKELGITSSQQKGISLWHV